jgi:hypothetical protein
VTPAAAVLSGHATPAATRAHAARFVARLPHGFGPLGSTGLTVSRIGFGGYRVDDETPEHRTALEHALEGGVNLIDTSTNYTDGGSERLVGSVLDDLGRAGRVAREAVVVVSKVGYVQGGNLALAREREAGGRPFPEMVKYGEGVWHCIHPEFLADQLERSLARLRLRTLDVCLLHNPEHFLSEAQHHDRGPAEARRQEFERRLAAAFGFLEDRVAAGVVGCYGVSSNTVAKPSDDPEATSLTRMLAAAQGAGGPAHRFRVLQLPMNLAESEGLTVRKDGPDGQATVLEWAAAQGIGVLLNRPLNAIVGTGMLRLADVGVGAPEVSVPDQLRAVAALEEEYRREIAAHVEVSRGSHSPAEFFRWGSQLAGLEDRVQTLDRWREIEWQVRRVVSQVAQALDAGLSGALGARWGAWRARYQPALDGLLAALRARAAEKSRARSRAVAATVDPCLPADRRGESLSRKALWVLASTPGVSVVLSGIRTPAYVEDALGILRWPPLAEPRPAYDAMARKLA